jgi:hypothetical protein
MALGQRSPWRGRKSLCPALLFGERIVTVELRADRDRRPALAAAVLVGVPQRIDAAAVFLLIEFFAFTDPDHPL